MSSKLIQNPTEKPIVKIISWRVKIIKEKNKQMMRIFNEENLSNKIGKGIKRLNYQQLSLF